MDYANKPVLITGCSSGIGWRAAQLLHERGYPVIATARSEEGVARLRDLGFDAQFLEVTDYAQVDALLDHIQTRYGKLYGVFNNAGYSQVGAAEDLPDEALREQFDTNFFAVTYITNQVLKRFMRPQGDGRIIQNSSVMGIAAMSFRAAYCASKHALEAYTDALRQELALTDSNIRVGLVEPGPIVSRIRQNKQKFFLKYIEPIMHDSPHQRAYETMHKGLAMTGRIPFTLEPDAVVKDVIDILESQRPKPRYYQTRLTYMMGFIKRISSSRGYDKVALKITRKETGLDK